MSSFLELREQERYLELKEAEAAVRVVVVGVGGCGCNTINNLARMGLKNVTLVACNTDAAVLRRTKADKKVLLGPMTTKGRGAYGVPEIGRKAAEENVEDVLAAIGGNVDVVIGTAGMGGGTGTGALPVIMGEVRRRLRDAVAISVVTLPFSEEGEERIRNAQMGLQEVLENSDMVIVNSNDILVSKIARVSFDHALRIMDARLARVIGAIVRLQSRETAPGVINVDFHNFQRVTKDSGLGFIGVGTGARVYDAMENALKDDYSETELNNARAAIVYVEGPSPYLDLQQVRMAPRYISKTYNIPTVFFGVRPTWEVREPRVSVVASGVKSRYVEEFLEKGSLPG